MGLYLFVPENYITFANQLFTHFASIANHTFFTIAFQFKRGLQKQQRDGWGARGEGWGGMRRDGEGWREGRISQKSTAICMHS